MYMVTLRRRHGWIHTATATLILIFAVSGSEPPADVPAVSSPGSIRTNAMSFNAMSFNSLLLKANAQLADYSLVEIVAPGSVFEPELVADPYAREFMDYLVSCALDENDSLSWSGGGLSETWEGSLGLCPDWAVAAPSEECQEVVSACLLARTNAYGQSVEISLRGLRADESPLLLGATEAADFPWQEGGFFGNVFCEDCVDPSIDMFTWEGLLYYRYRLSDAPDSRFVTVACDSFVGLPEPEARRMRDECHWRFLQATRYEGVVYRAMFACWSPVWEDGKAYTLKRICAGVTSNGGYMADQKQCAAWPVGACTVVSPGVPGCQTDQICAVADSTPQDKDGDVDECKAMPMPTSALPKPGDCPQDPPQTAPVWNYPLTVFLDDPCALVRDQEACRVNREILDPFTGLPRWPRE
jgi:hypothetical protein